MQSSEIALLAFHPLLSILLNDELINTELLCSVLKHVLLDTVLHNEVGHIHLLHLSNLVSTVHHLQVSLEIPEWVVSTFHTC